MKKLELAKETVMLLNAENLEAVQGGVYYPTPFTPLNDGPTAANGHACRM